MAPAKKLKFDGALPFRPDEDLDLAHLNNSTLGDKTLREEILGLFLAQVEASVKSLPLTRDGSAWHYLTHTLKGAASAVGAKRIAALADEWGKSALPSHTLLRQNMASELAKALQDFRRAAAGL
jgi:HPt (histidine-containing phosphotransfer) domain-containing protein